MFRYADEILGLGREMQDALQGRPAGRSLRLVTGIDDVLPKEIADRLIEPALQLDLPVRIVCREAGIGRRRRGPPLARPKVLSRSYAISVERWIKNLAVIAICDVARREIFA